MLKWLFVVALIALVTALPRPAKGRWRLGALPGDFRFRLFGRSIHVPLTSTLLLSAAATLLLRAL